jgi:tetratricopeptide (TPR) repeat protein
LILFIRNQTKTAFQPIHFAAVGSVGSLFLLSLVDFHNNLTEMYFVPVFFLAGLGTSQLPSRQIQSPRLCNPVIFGLIICIWIGLVFCPFLNGIFRERGYAYLLDHQNTRAQEQYEWSLVFDPTDSETWNQLGHIARMTPSALSPFTMVKSMENAVYWAPRRASFRADLADALYLNGFPDRAVEEMKTAQDLFPVRPVYYERLAALYDTLGKSSEAQEQRQTAEALKTEIEEKRL